MCVAGIITVFPPLNSCIHPLTSYQIVSIITDYSYNLKVQIVSGAHQQLP